MGDVRCSTNAKTCVCHVSQISTTLYKLAAMNIRCSAPSAVAANDELLPAAVIDNVGCAEGWRVGGTAGDGGGVTPRERRKIIVPVARPKMIQEVRDFRVDGDDGSDDGGVVVSETPPPTTTMSFSSDSRSCGRTRYPSSSTLRLPGDDHHHQRFALTLTPTTDHKIPSHVPHVQRVSAVRSATNTGMVVGKGKARKRAVPDAIPRSEAVIPR